MDDDNMVKPIRDALNGVIYADDMQIRHAVYTQSPLRKEYEVAGVRWVLLQAFSAGLPFVYVLVEDAPTKVELPR